MSTKHDHNIAAKSVSAGQKEEEKKLKKEMIEKQKRLVVKAIAIGEKRKYRANVDLFDLDWLDEFSKDCKALSALLSKDFPDLAKDLRKKLEDDKPDTVEEMLGTLKAIQEALEA